MGLNLGLFDSHQTPLNLNYCLSSSNYSQDTKHNINETLNTHLFMTQVLE